MKLESLEKFQKDSMNEIELGNVNGGLTDVSLSVLEHATSGAKEVCTEFGCVSYSADWTYDDGSVYYYDMVVIQKPC